MADLKIISYNCRGLRDTNKRHDVLIFLKSQNAHVYCLQDTHFIPSMEKQIYSQWNGECYHSFGSSNSRGVSVLFKKNIGVKVHRTDLDPNGNYIVLDFTYDLKRFTLCALYGH